MKKFLLVSLLAVGASSAFAVELVVNGGFEPDATGWTIAHLGSFSGVTTTPNSTNWVPHTGAYCFHMGATSSTDQSDVFQDIATTVGTTYTVSVWALDLNPADATAGFNATFGGTTFAARGPSLTSAYTQFSANIVATSALTRLEFTGYEATQYIQVDDFSVQAQAVPEPASMAALGLGVVALLRRRRKA